MNIVMVGINNYNVICMVYNLIVYLNINKYKLFFV